MEKMRFILEISSETSPAADTEERNLAEQVDSHAFHVCIGLR